MSIRSAMMAEIKQRLRGSGGSAEPAGPAGAGGSTGGEIGGGYIPKIHQPRAAKSLEGGLVGKMNKLLDSKFQKMMGGGAPTPGGPPSAGGPPRGPPSAPPRAPPSSGGSGKKEKKKKDKKKKDKGKTDSQLSDLEKKIREKLG